jgi:hypothetical protein
MVSPADSFSKINSTVILVPSMWGFPIMIAGSDLINLFGILSSPFHMENGNKKLVEAARIE